MPIYLMSAMNPPKGVNDQIHKIMANFFGGKIGRLKGKHWCKKKHPAIAQGSGISHVWRKIIQIREEVKHNIWWQIRNGEESFWFDNWTKKGALYYLEEQNHSDKEIEVKEFIKEGVWDEVKLN
ncbi:hypothetical protein H5410_002612 [Solanum commersonii]|uniref:Uncharacterized protein n=1 Tax=Solanum commersonii TaxID=4109 RepID=A0A9J6B3C7_SOLCO|nr:hypothetical protein H5410_002612 [Solanum commersonii]